jgi:hypothetical protein
MADWTMISAVSAATIVTGVVAFEVFAFVNPSPAPVKRAAPLASYGSSVERSANELPGFATGRSGEQAPSFPLLRLIDPDRTFDIDAEKPAAQPSKSAVPKKAPPPPITAKTEAPSGGKASTDVQTAKLTPQETAPAAAAAPPPPQPRVDQWRVVITSKASYFNLGGHVNAAGMVDSLAGSHLRDALKEHKNFAQLPPDIKNHILTQPISLTKIAPYRGLLGINDRTMEDEQGIRFERVASR